MSTRLQSRRNPVASVKAAVEGQDGFHHVQDIAWYSTHKISGRQLTPREIDGLNANGNMCLPGVTWQSVRTTANVALNFIHIRKCTFGKNCTIGNFAAESHCDLDGQEVPCGLYNSTIINSTLMDNCLVRDTTLVAGCIVGHGAVIVGCGNIVYRPSPEEARAGGITCGNGSFLPLAVETGGRDTPIFAEQALEDAAVIAGDRSNTEQIALYEKAVKEYVEKVKCAATIIVDDAVVLNCPRIENSFVGYSASVISCTIKNSTILSAKGKGEGERHKDRTHIGGGAYVENSIVQWGCHIDSMAIVTGSLMCTHSHADRHGKVIDSVIGPCTGVSEGEVTSSLVGPFVGFHHQALLIASFWPAGRGNIGYGANVGSNHTGKVSDQELWPGEGTFFGLATAIKFPSNFSHAPYCLIATGVTSLPQRLDMPFSLINAPGEMIAGVSPAFNEISPGWTLGSNLFMILRNESKFKKRGQAVAHRVQYESEILRPDTIELLRKARTGLFGAGGKARIFDSEGSPVYTDKEAPGIGKNYMKEKARESGISTYSRFIRFYAVRALFRAWQEDKDGDCAPHLLLTDHSPNGKCNEEIDGVTVLTDTISRRSGGQPQFKYTCQWYFYARDIFLAEFGDKFTVKDALRTYDQMNTEIGIAVLQSKQKDDKRGPRIIDGYSHAHAPAEDEKVIKTLLEENRMIHGVIMGFLSSL